MKKLLITALKVIIFFTGWAACIGICDIPSDNPTLWRLEAEAIPLVIIIIFSIIFWLIEKRKIKIISFQKPILNFWVGVGTGIAWLGLTVIVMCLTGALSFSGSNEVAYLYVWMLSCFLNVIMQELLVRGYIYQLIKSQYNMVAAIIATTILFTVMHGGAFEAGIVAVLNVISMSVFMSLVLECTRSLVAPILIHTAWNIVGAIILGGVSLTDDYPHLLNAVFSGNALLSGGSCKMEGSIIILVLNVIFSFIFLFMLKRTKANAAK